MKLTILAAFAFKIISVVIVFIIVRWAYRRFFTIEGRKNAVIDRIIGIELKDEDIDNISGMGAFIKRDFLLKKSEEELKEILADCQRELKEQANK